MQEVVGKNHPHKAALGGVNPLGSDSFVYKLLACPQAVIAFARKPSASTSNVFIKPRFNKKSSVPEFQG